MVSPQEIKLVRMDLTANEQTPVEEMTEIQVVQDLHGSFDRNMVLSKCQLPEDSVLKLYYDGKLIPWSMVSKCTSIEIHVFRPHQNVKPKTSEARLNSDVLIRQKVKELECRIASLEAVADPSIISMKTDRDLQILTKQISFLGKRLDEADQAEWIKKV